LDKPARHYVRIGPPVHRPRGVRTTHAQPDLLVVVGRVRDVDRLPVGGVGNLVVVELGSGGVPRLVRVDDLDSRMLGHTARRLRALDVDGDRDGLAGLEANRHHVDPDGMVGRLERVLVAPVERDGGIGGNAGFFARAVAAARPAEDASLLEHVAAVNRVVDELPHVVLVVRQVLVVLRGRTEGATVADKRTDLIEVVRIFAKNSGLESMGAGVDAVVAPGDRRDRVARTLVDAVAAPGDRRDRVARAVDDAVAAPGDRRDRVARAVDDAVAAPGDRRDRVA